MITGEAFWKVVTGPARKIKDEKKDREMHIERVGLIPELEWSLDVFLRQSDANRFGVIDMYLKRMWENYGLPLDTADEDEMEGHRADIADVDGHLQALVNGKAASHKKRDGKSTGDKWVSPEPVSRSDTITLGDALAQLEGWEGREKARHDQLANTYVEFRNSVTQHFHFEEAARWDLLREYYTYVDPENGGLEDDDCRLIEKRLRDLDADKPDNGKLPEYKRPGKRLLAYLEDSTDLNTSARFVARVLLDHYSQQNYAFPKQETLARLTGCSVRTVSTALRSLVDAKVLRVVKPYQYGDRYASTVYDFTAKTKKAMGWE